MKPGVKGYVEVPKKILNKMCVQEGDVLWLHRHSDHVSLHKTPHRIIIGTKVIQEQGFTVNDGRILVKTTLLAPTKESYRVFEYNESNDSIEIR